MAWHLFSMNVTNVAVAANNRGENEGNITTLQKVLWEGVTHTCVSGEAIRRGLRRVWSDSGKVLRENQVGHEANFDPVEFLDDDVLGFMQAQAAKAEDEEDGSGGKRKRLKGTVTSRTGPLNVSRAISLEPYHCEVSFNSRSGDKNRTSLYGTEFHATAYQYGWALTPRALMKPERVSDVVLGFLELRDVGGNHGRFLYDFSPQSIIYRWTQDFAPRFLYCYEKRDQIVSASKIKQLVERNDLSAQELWVGGDIADSPIGKFLQSKGAQVYPGIKEVSKMLLTKIMSDLEIG